MPGFFCCEAPQMFVDYKTSPNIPPAPRYSINFHYWANLSFNVAVFITPKTSDIMTRDNFAAQ